tara:strand:- start:472 stop:765 length:294 start_codon:yes stop_codon:yes gene_type:complete
VKILTELNLDFEIIEYLKEPLGIADLKKISEQLGLKPIEFVRQNDKVIKERINQLDSDSLLSEMSANPKIIERPIVIYNGKAIIARPPEKIFKLLKM